MAWRGPRRFPARERELAARPRFLSRVARGDPGAWHSHETMNAIKPALFEIEPDRLDQIDLKH